jgi:chemotaxis protein CheC
VDELKLDILNEAGNIGAAHAATALGQLLERTVMISVTRVSEPYSSGLPSLAGDPEALVAGVGFHVVGDASGRILLWLPRRAAVELVDLLLRQAPGTTKVLNELGHSTIKETGNIMASAYLTGLCEFCGLLLMPTVPALLFDLSQAVVEMAAEGVERSDGRLLCVENSFEALDTGISGRLFFFIDASSEDALTENATGAF